MYSGQRRSTGAKSLGRQRRHPILMRQLEAGLLDVLPFEASADTTYAAIGTRLQQAGRPNGGNDLLIAVQTMTLGCTIA
jgi:tRNA(fMet)-specific endonuclease VapC